MNKNKSLIIVLIILLLAAAVFGFAYAYKASLNSITEKSIAAENEKSDLPDRPFNDNAEKAPGHEPPQDKITYLVECTFEGMIDQNSFEISDENNEVYQLRIIGERQKGFIEGLDIGEKLTVECHYNNDNQLVADKIMLKNLK